MIIRNKVICALITSLSKTRKRIRGMPSIISHYKIPITNFKFRFFSLRYCFHPRIKIVFIKLKAVLTIRSLHLCRSGFCITDIGLIVYKFYCLSWKSDNSLNVRNFFSWRNKNNNLSPLKRSKPLSDLFYNNPITWFKSRKHTYPNNRIRSSNKKPNKQNHTKNQHQKGN